MVSLDQVTSADGTTITYEVQGSGPAIVIVPGALRAAEHYRTMASHLADEYTVYAINRRGRGGSGAKGANYSVVREGEDLAAVLERCGPALVFGHSYGGFVVMENARRLGLDRIALYEPALSIDGSVPTDWLSDFEYALAQGNPARALVLALRGIHLGGILDRIPVAVASVPIRMLMRAPIGRSIADLLPTMPSEIREVSRLSSDGRRYGDIAGQLLVLHGEKSPAYLKNACELLISLYPDCTAHTIAKAGHNAPDQDDPATVAAVVRGFMTAHPQPTPQ